MKTLKDRLESHYVVPAASSEKMSKTARFRLHFNDVQSAIAHGVPLAVILAEINQDGYNITLPTLKSMLQRVRKEKGLTSPQSKKKPNPQQIELGQSKINPEPLHPKSTENISAENEEAEAEYKILEEKYPYIKEYSHIPRFRKINDSITICGDTVEEQYYSMGGDPRDLKDLSSRKRSEKIDNRYFEIVSQKYIYKNIKA
ncbi:hypothetical protein [Shewanella oncorhynchi]|uniref:hypothetical protein n=1 Tax=Shewanella oncorhynchi TaxID=2726434 RepID=UPI003D7BF4E1